MDKNKLSYYASFVAIACGILILVSKIIDRSGSNGSTFMGILFVVIGVIGLRRFKKSQ